jgi:hypothetical protein
MAALDQIDRSSGAVRFSVVATAESSSSFGGGGIGGADLVQTASLS